ncbi:hypothetical protein [Streptomyces prunicolor]|uniref:hypothetical protein n=1 Tax=Streptomyces prunicolor TaxID=67348 RepID=UPI0003735630|nr:hypothetical protein [Streptomyces prunicolor]
MSTPNGIPYSGPSYIPHTTLGERQLRLLPWNTPDGKPCYLSSDHDDSRLSLLADDGRRTRLPYFDDWQLPDFHTELADLRAVSALHRGMDWELRPDTEDRIRRRARDRKVWGAVCVAAVFAPLAAFVFLA